MAESSIDKDRAIRAKSGQAFSRDLFDCFKDLPCENADAFKSLVGKSERLLPIYDVPEGERSAVPKEAKKLTKNPRSYTSFGDEGTTASMNAFGNLLQITKYLGTGKSGFFSVDMSSISEPLFVRSRAHQLFEAYGNPNEGLTYYWDNVHPGISDMIDEPVEFEFVRDRWPRSSFNATACSGQSQYFTRNGIVFTRDLYIAKSDSESVPLLSASQNRNISFAAKEFLIRELEFLNWSYTFNDTSDWDSPSANYTSFLGPHGYSMIIAHRGFEADTPGSSSADVPPTDPVALVVSVRVNGRIRELQKLPDDPDTYIIKLNDNETIKATSTEPFELTLAYRLQLTPYTIDWKTLLIPVSEFIEMDKEFDYEPTRVHPEPYRKLPFTARSDATDASNKHLDFIIRRNIEHVLAVCSIPVPSIRDKDGTTAVALTCGDISGHRLVTSASFFAFELLLSVARYLEAFESERNHPARCDCTTNDRSICAKTAQALRSRIKSTCRRHLLWIREAGKHTKQFASNYWASGKAIDGGEYITDYSAEGLSLPSLADTPYQMIKVGDFADTFPEHKELASDILQPLVRPWVEKLREGDKRRFFAFPRPTSAVPGQIKRYRLEDHVWIWRAMRAIQRLNLGEELEEDDRNKQHSRKATTSQKTVTSNDLAAQLQRQVLKRFSTDNTATSQRMLAVGRSASDNRFLFRSRDTALFYEGNESFFVIADPLWRATIDTQQWHEENEDSRWSNPLRYALALVLGSKDFPVNSRTAAEMLTVAKDVLLQSSGTDGIFPGQLNAETKEPAIFENIQWRDFYFHASFEIAYALWEYANQDKGNHNLQNKAKEPDPSSGQNDPKKDLKVRKSLPLNNLIDKKSIVEIPDEWLYNSPDFLHFDPKIDEKLKQRLELEQKKPIPSRTNGFIQKAQKVFQRESSENTRYRGTILDVPRTSHVSSKQGMKIRPSTEEPIEPMDNAMLYDTLKIPRSMDDAKKRLIWLPNANRNTRLLCVLASPERESSHVSNFFNRHAQRHKYFFDEATATANIWKTEFHLSSYQKLDAKKVNPLPSDLKFLGGEDKVLRRAGMGFRFVGDFFDRFWTCHVLEYEPNDDSKRKSMFLGGEGKTHIETGFHDLIHRKNGLNTLEREKRPWRQRKYLELCLFGRMLEKIDRRNKEMLGEVGKELTTHFPGPVPPGIIKEDVVMVSNALFSTAVDTTTYSSISKMWPAVQYTLQVMEDDLKENLEKITLWNYREKERQLEKPRWTSNDETKYRAAITRISASNSYRIRKLERYLAQIRSLRTSLTSRLEATRNELNFQSAGDMQVFTYITAVFLPLGFATSLFSMGAIPNGGILNGMLITAAVTLSLTFCLMFNIRGITRGYNKIETKLISGIPHRAYIGTSSKNKKARRELGSDDARLEAGPIDDYDDDDGVEIENEKEGDEDDEDGDHGDYDDDD